MDGASVVSHHALVECSFVDVSSSSHEIVLVVVVDVSSLLLCARDCRADREFPGRRVCWKQVGSLGVAVALFCVESWLGDFFEIKFDKWHKLSFFGYFFDILVPK